MHRPLFMEGARSPVVLVIEDNPDLAVLFRELIEAEGCTVLTAGDGKQALAILAVCPTDLVVCDLMLPVMDGFDFSEPTARGPLLTSP